MAQGTRERIIRVAAAGFAVFICTGLVGCMDLDKRKDAKLFGKQQPTQTGLPGTPKLDAAGNVIGKNSQPASQFNNTGASLQPSGSRFGTSGLNTNTSGGNTPFNYQSTPGQPTSLNTPTIPASVQPPAPVMGAQPSGGFGNVPPPPSLDSNITPPPPPANLTEGPVGMVQPPGASYSGLNPIVPAKPNQ